MAYISTAKQLLSSDSPERIALVDARPHNALDLLTGIICYRARNLQKRVLFYAWEHSVIFWTKRFAAAGLADRISVQDGFAIEASLSSQNIKSFFSSLTATAAQNPDTMLVFHSLTTILLVSTASDFCRFLSSLPTTCDVVYLLHQDVLDSHSVSAVRSISTAEIRIKDSSTTKGVVRYSCVVNYTPRRRTHINRTEQLTVSSGWILNVDSSSQLKQKADPVLQTSSSDSVLENVTFNLKLTDDEIAARNRVKLPHAQGAGVIYYEPDENDDIDYEDPDE